MKRINRHAILPAAGRLLPLFCLMLALTLALLPAAQRATPASAPATVAAAAPSQTAPALSFGKKLIPLGRTTGIKLFSEGTMVVGFAPVAQSASPAEQAGLQAGDVILALNGGRITSNESLIAALAGMTERTVALRVRRGAAEREVTFDAVRDPDGGSWRIGAWVRDSIAGIGTITFVDPDSGAFGALGHGICDADTGALMPFGTGAVMASEVAAVEKGRSGRPGQLTGSFNLSADQGALLCNTEHGIFGTLTDQSLYGGREAAETAPKSAIRTGRATILSNVSGTETRAYEVEILRVYDDGGDGRDLMLRVTDPALLAATGGIVQGMSGSPIMQDGRLIGAVTHVLVNDPQRGYGISIQTMLDGFTK